ncbi:MAG: hypothetical protein AABX54_03100 [Nanoarchaeota archaeon]
MQHLYFYYHTNENFRKIVLIPKESFPFASQQLRDLEGILITEERIPINKQTFSITKQEAVEKSYKGKFMPFSEYK